jgi:hypothetical protein
MGEVMDRFGTGALFFTALAAVLLVLSAWAAVRLVEIRRCQLSDDAVLEPAVGERQAA